MFRVMAVFMYGEMGEIYLPYSEEVVAAYVDELAQSLDVVFVNYHEVTGADTDPLGFCF